MQSQRETVTDRLADIIHILHLGGKSGTLTVERSEGRTLEEGVIVFIEGRVVEAKTGGQSGMVAFNYLSSWMMCRFSFISYPMNNLPGTRSPALLPAPSSQRRDGRGFTNGTPSSSAATPVNRQESRYQYNDESPRSTPPLRLTAGEIALQRPEGSLLPRIHRRLLLLVNGQRSTSELARLMGRSHQEVQPLLSDLERAGLIKQ